jgi:hypothetical protein
MKKPQRDLQRTSRLLVTERPSNGMSLILRQSSLAVPICLLLTSTTLAGIGSAVCAQSRTHSGWPNSLDQTAIAMTARVHWPIMKPECSSITTRLDPAGSDQHARALRALRDYVNQVDSEQLQREDVLHGANHARRAPTAAGSFNRSHQIKPRQPDGVSCGICILAMVELIGEGRFNEEPKDKFTSHEISCYRARWACLLLHSPELNGDHGVALARRRAQNSESEIDVT